MRRESENLITQASEDLETAGVLQEGRRFYAGGLLAMPVSGVELLSYTPEEFERGRGRDDVRALRGQYPMLALMVGYTVTSLWRIAQPIVGEA